MSLSPQVTYSLKKAGIMLGLAIVGSVAANYTGVLQAANVDPVWYPVAGAVVAGAVRWFEGVRDADRAAEGKIIGSDVGFDVIKDELADNPGVNSVVQTDEDTIFANNPAMAGPGPFSLNKPSTNPTLDNRVDDLLP